MIDKSLNYGRQQIEDFLTRSAPHSSVLDLGAGEGGDLALARKVSPGARLHALEFWPPYVETLRAAGVDVHSIDLERDRFPFPDESVDAVIVNQVMEHVKDVFWILHQTTRVLRRGGHLIVGVPNLAALHNRVLLAVGRQPSCIKNVSAHVRGYTRRDMIALVGLAGELDVYRLAGFAGSNFYPFPHRLAVPLARLAPAMATSIFFDFEKIGPYRRQYLDYPAAKHLETSFFVG